MELEHWWIAENGLGHLFPTGQPVGPPPAPPPPLEPPPPEPPSPEPPPIPIFFTGPQVGAWFAASLVLPPLDTAPRDLRADAQVELGVAVGDAFDDGTFMVSLDSSFTGFVVEGAGGTLPTQFADGTIFADGYSWIDD